MRPCLAQELATVTVPISDGSAKGGWVLWECPILDPHVLPPSYIALIMFLSLCKVNSAFFCSLVEALDVHDCASQLRLDYLWGTTGLSIEPQTLANFWQSARTVGLEWAQHDGIQNHIPIKIFGDDARLRSRSGEQVYALFLSCPLFRPLCARSSRWLVWSMRSSMFLGRVRQLGF